MTRPTLLIAVALLVAGCGPLVMLPGGALSGEPKPVPADWSFSKEIDTVQLETNPEDPYSVNVWGVASGPHFYIAAGQRTNQWAENLRADPDARLRVGDDLYEVTAVEVDDETEIETVLVALQEKYDFEPDPEDRANAALFRFGAR